MLEDRAERGRSPPLADRDLEDVIGLEVAGGAARFGEEGESGPGLPGSAPDRQGGGGLPGAGADDAEVSRTRGRSRGFPDEPGPQAEVSPADHGEAGEEARAPRPVEEDLLRASGLVEEGLEPLSVDGVSRFDRR